jgi:hypothetical protein
MEKVYEPFGSVFMQCPKLCVIGLVDPENKSDTYPAVTWFWFAHLLELYAFRHPKRKVDFVTYPLHKKACQLKEHLRPTNLRVSRVLP